MRCVDHGCDLLWAPLREYPRTWQQRWIPHQGFEIKWGPIPSDGGGQQGKQGVPQRMFAGGWTCPLELETSFCLSHIHWPSHQARHRQKTLWNKPIRYQFHQISTSIYYKPRSRRLFDLRTVFPQLRIRPILVPEILQLLQNLRRPSAAYFCLLGRRQVGQGHRGRVWRPHDRPRFRTIARVSRLDEAKVSSFSQGTQGLLHQESHQRELIVRSGQRIEIRNGQKSLWKNCPSYGSGYHTLWDWYSL